MPATYSQVANAQEFILSEANGQRSLENGNLAASQDITAGECLMLSTGKLVQWDGAADIAGISLYNVVTTADTAISYLARDAEVNVKLLTYPGGTKAVMMTKLALIKIIARD